MDRRSRYLLLGGVVLTEVAGYVAWRRTMRRGDVEASVTVGPAARPAAVVAVKAVHTLAWASIEACVAYVLWAGIAGRTDKRVGKAAAVVVGDSLVFAGNGFRCPLTELATRYGAESDSVTDIYLPRWFAHNLPAIHTPLLVHGVRSRPEPPPETSSRPKDP
jgi:hypothetical protein